MVSTEVVAKEKSKVNRTEDGLWTIEAQTNDLKSAFSSKSKNIFQGKGSFINTFVRLCKNNETRNLAFKEDLKEVKVGRSEMKKFSDFKYHTNDEISLIVLSIFTKIKLGQRYYFRYDNLIISVISSSELGLFQLHVTNISKQETIPVGSIVLRLKIYELVKDVDQN